MAAPEPIAPSLDHRPMRRLAVIANNARAGVQDALSALQAWADQHSIEVVLECRPGDQPCLPHGTWPLDDDCLRKRCEGIDAAVCLGGDGTLLFAARVLAPLSVPLLAVNLGSVGFHTQAQPEELVTRLEDVRLGQYRVEHRLMLRATHADGSSTLALNDLVISKPDWGHMIHVRVAVDGEPISDVDADSLVVATPTGSSGYNFAAGGPVLAPTMNALVLQAICPHRSRFSPVVTEAEVGIEIEIRKKQAIEECLILVDGHPWLRARTGDRIFVGQADVSLNLVTFRRDFWRQMREKLRWGNLV